MRDPAPIGRVAAPRPYLLVSLATVAMLAIFVGKPVHMDDPVYLWVAEQIKEHPLDFFGFSANWHGSVTPIAELNKNPPLVSYYLAASSTLLGSSEVSLHLAMMLPAIFLALGVQALAGRLGVPMLDRPGQLPTALLLLSLPAVVVSSTTLMADIPMLALWCWALVLWIRGLDEDSPASLFGAGLLIVLATLTKYIALCLVPLVVAYAVVRRRRVGLALLALLPTIALLIAFDQLMRSRYGVSSFGNVSRFALDVRSSDTTALESGLSALSFLGGGLLGATLLAPALWSRRAALAWLVTALALLAVLVNVEEIGPTPLRDDDGIRWLVVGQLALFAWGGLHLLGLALRELLVQRDATAWLLACWVLGIFVFAGFLNWTANIRVILPAAPAAVLLVARALARRRAAAQDAPSSTLRLGVAMAGGLAVAVTIAVAWADQSLARSARAAARLVDENHEPAMGKLWFIGSWGFQYYMEGAGGTRVDMVDSTLAPGDIVVVAVNNSAGGADILQLEQALAFNGWDVPVASWVATQSKAVGAGFYTDLWGPLPFAFGPVPPEHYLIARVEVPIRLVNPDGAPGTR